MSRVNKNLHKEFPQSIIDKLFVYDDESGDLLWSENNHDNADISRRRWGKPVGKVLTDGYRKVSVTYNGRKFCLMVDRIVWRIHTLEWPKGNLIHIDGNPENCAFNNFRLISPRRMHVISRLRRLLDEPTIGVRPYGEDRYFARMKGKQRTFDSFESAWAWRRGMLVDCIKEYYWG